ncbi:MAG: hypothetical protein ACOX2O_10740 [Bdellovibrionota bacterium]|jgi:hypothetical protein
MMISIYCGEGELFSKAKLLKNCLGGGEKMGLLFHELEAASANLEEAVASFS